ncbi:MAG: aminodeoxychorismate synthase component I [Planctomycetes bacterium]|nr:aminodeoxychorismate synthase component I [Planctomycetota bacterium]
MRAPIAALALAARRIQWPAVRCALRRQGPAVVVLKLASPPPPRAALSALASHPRPFLLESAERDDDMGRRSFAGADPFLTLTSRGRRIEAARADGVEVFEGDPLEALRERLRACEGGQDDAPTPFPAGAVGFLAYDLARCLERLPVRARDDLGLPDLCVDFHDAVITWDHVAGEAYVTSTGLPLTGAAGARRARTRAEALVAWLREAPPVAAAFAPAPAAALTSTFSRAEYVAAVERVRQYIAAGDIYQVNLSQRFRLPAAGSGLILYGRLAEVNPAPFAAYLRTPNGAEIVSASPERFLRVEGDRVETRPIKGTRPRGVDPDEDLRLADELLLSAKDRAELIMIVDLMRNDLGRVARFGSVKVTEFPALTRHPTVHHLHGTVTARLAPGRDVFDLLRHAFPGGSVTGAPKVRAMEIIEEIEPVRRGVYTGAIGYLSATGLADLSIAIRTLVVKDGVAHFSVGGGVVADSEPDPEYEETLHKGRGLARALGFTL